jgi:hypothetical protein
MPQNKMIKVVYFDEGSAMDFLEIKNRGVKDSTQTSQQTSSSEIGGEVGVKAGTGSILQSIASFLPSLELNAEAKSAFTKAGEKIIKNTISNSILSMYFDEAAKPETDGIVKIPNTYKISIPEESFTFLKTITPLMKMIDMRQDGEVNLNISSMDSVIDDWKGYYSVLATNRNNEEDKKVLRFNIKSFRGNYQLSDLTRMDLACYGVKVGETEMSILSAKNEFTPSNSRVPTDEEINGENTENQNKMYDLIDVVLCGIEK